MMRTNHTVLQDRCLVNFQNFTCILRTYRRTTCKKLDWYKLLGLLGDLVNKAQKGMLIKEAA